jgi:hypothetical protein
MALRTPAPTSKTPQPQAQASADAGERRIRAVVRDATAARLRVRKPTVRKCCVNMIPSQEERSELRSVSAAPQK